MFEIDEHNIPVVPTHSALLILDLQNDFDPVTGRLPVKHPPGFTENIINVLPYFRTTGHIVWVRSVFETSRPVNSIEEESEVVVTNKSIILGSRLRPSRSRTHRRPVRESNGRKQSNEADSNGDLISDEDEENHGISETFFTIEPGKKPQLVLQTTPGSNLCQAARAGGMDGNKDLIIQKSFYSAFKDGSLVQVLRSKFVTELYMCGSLTNISVFATAMDAVRHGYAITLLEDCLGYRSKRRHDMALKQMIEFTGCETMKSMDLIDDLKERAKTRKPGSSRYDRPTTRNTNIETLLSNLKITSEKSETAAVAGAERSAVSGSVATSEEQTSQTRLLETDGKKPERVRSKVRSRRRPSRQALNESIDTAGPTSGGPTKELDAMGSSPKHPLTAAVEESALEVASEDNQSSGSIKDCPGTISSSDSVQTLTNDTMEPDAMTKSMGQKGETDHSCNPKIPNGEILPPREPIPICEGDTTIIENLLNAELSEEIFAKVRDEVRWQKMSHQGGDVPRLICVQGEIGEDGSKPIYRHPADESPPLLPFSPTVSLIRAQVEARLGHPVNHVLIQFYRDGKDYISEHSDKTLDIVPNTFIANVSLGAQRTMVFRTKKPLKTPDSLVSEEAQPRQSCRAPLQHNSMCKMGLVTNMRWLHAIRQDKRMTSEKSAAELAYVGGRISLTYRQIGTFLDQDEVQIWGQGATGKTRDKARTVINGETPEAEQMIRAFGKENHSSDFIWDETYGSGFDILHIANSPKLFLSSDAVADLRVKLMLAEYNIAWTEGKLSPSFNWKDGSSAADAPPVPSTLPVKFVDNDIHKSTATGDMAIMLYLDAVYGASSRTAQTQSQAFLARQFTRFHECNELLRRWCAEPFSVKPFCRELEIWEARAQEAEYAAGDTISLADYALWPVVHEIAKEWGNCSSGATLASYYVRLLQRDAFAKAVGFVKETGEGPAFDIGTQKH